MEAITTVISWIWELIKVALPFAGGIYFGLWLDERRRKNRHLTDFEATVRAEAGMLAEFPDTLDDAIIQHHSASIARLDVFRNYMMMYDKKRWARIESDYNQYTMPGVTRNLATYRSQEIDPDRLIAQLNGLLHAIRRA